VDKKFDRLVAGKLLLSALIGVHTPKRRWTSRYANYWFSDGVKIYSNALL